MSGTFSRWQPRYAERGIATFPVTAQKTPATKGYLQTGIRGSAQLAQKFQHADAFGFACGPHSKITLADVDTADERALADALSVYGDSPIISRTASGGFHAWYRHNGESRRIRRPGDLPIDILGGGYAVAPPSQVAKGAYQFIRGGLDDLDRLKPMAGSSPVLASPLPVKWTGMREGDGRNCALWERCMRTGGGCSLDRMMEIARDANQEFKEPMMDAEVVKIATSAWQHDAAGLNFFTRPRIMLDHDAYDALDSSNPDAVRLLLKLERFHGGNSTFVLSKAMAPTMGWGWDRWYAARDALVESSIIRCIKHGGRGPNDPPIYGWALKG